MMVSLSTNICVIRPQWVIVWWTKCISITMRRYRSNRYWRLSLHVLEKIPLHHNFDHGYLFSQILLKWNYVYITENHFYQSLIYAIYQIRYQSFVNIYIRIYTKMFLFRICWFWLTIHAFSKLNVAFQTTRKTIGITHGISVIWHQAIL